MTLRLSSIHFSYSPGAEKVLEEMSLELRKGELYTLLGGSGSGKTTVLKLVAGFIRPSMGRVLIGGRDVTGLPPEKRAVGFVFQNYALFPHMDVRSNISYGMRGGGKEREKKVDDLIGLLRLEGLGKRSVEELSGGQMQRVALARALGPDPELLLLDEPLSALDASLRAGLRKELRSVIKERGLTALYVTHDQEEALDLSDRIGVLKGGRVLEEGSPRRIYWRPGKEYTAHFMGFRNIFSPVPREGGTIEIPVGRLPWRGPVPERIGFRPSSVRTKGSGLKLKGRVLSLTYRGADQLLEMEVNGYSIYVSLPDNEGISMGSVLELTVPYSSMVPMNG
ncbi:MAG: ABC transporter ATP-binding protein [Thermoplasmatota archaeon]